MTRLLLAGAICLALPAQAQILDQAIYSCNLLVNGVRVSWPPLGLSERECDQIKNELRKNDQTKATIECACEIGGRA